MPSPNGSTGVIPTLCRLSHGVDPALWDSQERYPEAAAHFHNVTKKTFAQKAEFVRRGSSRTFTSPPPSLLLPKATSVLHRTKGQQSNPRDLWPWVRKVNQISPPNRQTKKAPEKKQQQKQWGHILEPCRSGALTKRRIGWNPGHG